ncbi:MAG: PDZ domain-containing protein [Calothrix sp. SM1_5_4]|nr:PDZ domain-containing protein [Calothrix sp. SM1_5_4]
MLLRACHLAYSPACHKLYPDGGKRSVAAEDDRNANESSPKNCFSAEAAGAFKLAPAKASDGALGQKITQLSKSSILSRSGLQVGDVLTKVNGEPYSGPEQLEKAATSGEVALEIDRNGKSVPLTVSCP